MMLDNASYNKVKLIHELSSTIWFIEKHALPDAQKSGDRDGAEALVSLQRDLERHLEKLQKVMCLITQ